MITSVLCPSIRRGGFTFLAAIVLSLSTHALQEEVQAPPPSGRSVGSVSTSVVWILLDACRHDHLSCYGYARETSPNIDALAKRGTLFERNYAQAPNTLLSVPSYMTGRFEPVFYQDARHLDIRFLKTPPEYERLASSIFSENGFETAMFSASPWYTERSRLAMSFDTFEWLRHGEDVPEGTFEERNPALFQWLDAQEGRPFFLYIHSLDTHEPRFKNNTDEKWLNPTFPRPRGGLLRKWRGAPYSFWDQEHIRDLYDGAISYADETVGEVVHKLKSLGILNSTLIIISSDHGELLGQDGKTLGHPPRESYDDLLRSPLIIAGPGMASNCRVASKSQNADILPTLVDLLSLETKARFDGRSLLPQMRSPNGADPREYVFARSAATTPVHEPNRILIFDDMKFDLSPLDAAELERFYHGSRKAVEVWAMPDTLITRKAIEAPSARITSAIAILRDRFEPLWHARNNRPMVAPKIFSIEHGGTPVPDAITAQDEPEDNKWFYRSHGRINRWTEPGQDSRPADFLISYAWLEDAPELVFGINVPNGTYTISIHCKTLKYGPVRRGSSFRFAVSKAKPPHPWPLYELEAATTDEPNKKWIDVGTYTVTDNEMIYWIDQGNQDDFAVVGNLRFVQVGVDDSELLTPEELEAERERLESLGYLK